MIIQNAIYIPQFDEVLISRYRHDFCQSKFCEHFTDGGCDYIRRTTGDPPYQSLDLDENDPIELKVQRMLWGTRGVNGDEPLKYVFLKDCSKDHLNKILEIPGIYHPVKEVIEYLLNEDKVPGTN